MSLDPDLFEACRAGDARAWRRVVQSRAPAVFRWSVMLGLRPAEAEDASQEILWRAWRRFDRCRAPQAFDAWLYQITRRVVANMRRLVWLKRVLPSETPPEPAFIEGPSPEVELSVRACLETLSRKQAEVLLLSDIEGYTRDEVAEMLAIPPGTVASRLRLARQAFRAAWDRRHPGAPPVAGDDEHTRAPDRERPAGDVPRLSWEQS